VKIKRAASRPVFQPPAYDMKDTHKHAPDS
jgi:hypothetical protein